jgi:hypothetical protein
MRGSPLIQALILAIVLALAGVPVWSLTRPHEHVEPAKPKSAEPAAVARDVVVTSTSEAEVEISLSGTVVWRGQPAAKQFETTLTLPPDAEIVASTRWTQGGTNAARFQISHDGETLTDATLWGDTEASDVLPTKTQPSAP